MNTIILKLDGHTCMFQTPKAGGGKYCQLAAHSQPQERFKEYEDLSSLSQEYGGQVVIETKSTIYIHSGYELTQFSKKELFSHALSRFILGIDELQCVMGYTSMGEIQKRRLNHYLLDMLSTLEELPESVHIPIFATFNYIKQSKYNICSLPQYISISTKSDLWTDIMQIISSEITSLRPEEGVVPNLSLTFSHIVKNIFL